MDKRVTAKGNIIAAQSRALYMMESLLLWFAFIEVQHAQRACLLELVCAVHAEFYWFVVDENFLGKV